MLEVAVPEVVVPEADVKLKVVVCLIGLDA